MKEIPKIKVGVVEFYSITAAILKKDRNEVPNKLQQDQKQIKKKVKEAINTIRTDSMGPRTNNQEGVYKKADKLLDTNR